ncbi:MAG TPA: hypothetical protein VNM89_05920 [Solirubrobacterales bacterium]|nr:hypothetical protein [Solirubrobacterales bacterium]
MFKSIVTSSGLKFGRAALLLLASVAALAPFAGAPKARAQALTSGVTDPSHTYDAPPLAYQRIRGTGARLVRLTIGWDSIAPRKEPKDWDPTDPTDPNYWWHVADSQVMYAVAAGLEPVIAITSAPSWGQGCDRKDLPGAVCELDSAAYADFAEAMARRYSGSFGGLPRVRYWQAQNEPNLFLFFNPQFRDGQPVSPDLYRAILRDFSVAVKSVDETNLVISAGLAPLTRPGGIGPLDFTRRLLCMQGHKRPRASAGDCGGAIPFDIFAVNPYTTGGPTHQGPHPDDVSLGDLPELQRLLRAADRAGRIRGQPGPTPLWITEFGWDTRPPDPGGLPLRIAARWTAEAMFRAWRAGVSAFIWYGLRDQERHNLPFNQTVDSGFFTRGATLAEDKPKRALLEAFRFPVVALNRRRGLLVWGKTPSGGPGRVRIQLRTGRHWRPLAMARADRGGIFRKKLRNRRRGKVRAVFGRQRSVPFSLRYVEDFYQPPFG